MHSVLILLDDPSLRAITARGQELLAAFRVPYELRLASSALLPSVLEAWIQDFEKGGGQVILCGTENSQRLGDLAGSISRLPVLVVASLEAAMSSAPGPFARLGYGEAGFAQAALFACQILATSQADLARQLQLYRLSQSAGAEELDLQYKVAFDG